MNLALLAALLSGAAPALAQIPVYVPAEAASAPPPEAPNATAEASAPIQIAPLPSAPLPAKTAIITEQHRAAPPPVERAEHAEIVARSRPKWYGWQTLIVDGSTLSSFIMAGVVGSRGGDGFAAASSLLGAASYEFAPGIIHMAHGNVGRGFASFGMRIGLPLAGAFIGAAAASGCDGFFCEAGGAAVGLLVGAGGAIAIDAAVFAYEDPKHRAPDQLARRPLLVALHPVVAVTPKRAFIGLAGEL